MVIEQKTPQISSPRALSLNEAFDDFMLYQRANRHTAGTIKHYSHALGKLIEWLRALEVESVEQVESQTLRRFCLELMERGLADNTVHNHMRAVRAFFRYLVREGSIVRNPMENVKMPRLEKKILPAFTEDEIGRLLKACEGTEFVSVRNRLLVRFLLDSGLRLSECASLTVGSVDSETGVMRVMGKGRKERVTRIGTDTLRLFRKYLRLVDSSPSAPLWQGKRGGMTKFGIAETLEKLGNRAGVHAHPHKFRRTCALRLLRSGADVFSVQLLLGHSDLTVLRRYLAQTEEDVLGVHARILG